MYTVKEFRFGGEALSYMTSQLAQGDTLARLLLELPLADGEIWTFLPPMTSSQDRRQFQKGGIVKKLITEKWLIPFILEHLRAGPRHYAVFETLARAGDPSLSTGELPYILYGKEVYYFLRGSLHSQEAIRRVIRFARGYPFVGTLTCLPGNFAEISEGEQVSASTLHDFAKLTDHLLIGVYDDESRLVWSRPRR